jgi:hypothetical protein
MRSGRARSRAAGLVAAVVALLAACDGGSATSSHRQPPSASAASSSPGNSLASMACGHSEVRQGSAPDWLSDWGLPPDSVYVLSSGGAAAGVLFPDVLRAGVPSSGLRNKILWVAQPPLQAGFTVTAHPLGQASPIVHVFHAAPGQLGQYPSYDNVPRAGCWRFVLSSTSTQEFVDLHYSP